MCAIENIEEYRPRKEKKKKGEKNERVKKRNE
jgi:hypothetical protein